jgi:hypothetical protein
MVSTFCCAGGEASGVTSTRGVMNYIIDSSATKEH